MVLRFRNNFTVYGLISLLHVSGRNVDLVETYWDRADGAVE
jgi:hypothetical protein